MRMVLVRHGETDLNAKGVYRGKAVGRALRGVRPQGSGM
jgi:broad specificity phosphatase PhoE